MLTRPDETPCPSCNQSLWHSFLGDPGCDLTPEFVPEEIAEIWTDGVIVQPGYGLSKDDPLLPEWGEFIGKCPSCSSIFPDYFIPWSHSEINGRPDKRFVMFSTREPETSKENSLLQCNLEETISYINHLKQVGAVSTWECWTAIQQVIFLANHAIRQSGELPAALVLDVRSSMRIMTSSLEGAMEGAFAPRQQLPSDSERGRDWFPDDWATFSDMFRIAGDFDHAEQYLRFTPGFHRYQQDIEQLSDFGALEAEARSRRLNARLELIESLIAERSDVLATSTRRFQTRCKESTRRVFTFYVNDEGADIGVYGQVAETREEVENHLTKLGLRDFFLFEERDLAPDESESAADFRIKLSPHLGPTWIPVVNAVQRVLEDSRSKFFRIQTLAGKYDFDPQESPYVQGLVLEDGRFHLEVPRYFLETGRLSQSKIDQLQFIGWNLPGDTESTFNFWRAFDYGWNARSVAEFALETLTSVFEVTEEDFFDFGAVWQPDVIWGLKELHRVRIAPSNPKGSIFRIPDNDKYQIRTFDESAGREHVGFAEKALDTPYPQSHEERVASYLSSLEHLHSVLSGLRIGQAIEVLGSAIDAFHSQGFNASAEKASGLLSALESVPSTAFSEGTWNSIHEARLGLQEAVEVFPFPLGRDKEVLFDHLPLGLQNLLTQMVDRVLSRNEEEGRLIALNLIEFCGGQGKLLESEIQKEMSKVLRFLIANEEDVPPRGDATF